MRPSDQVVASATRRVAGRSRGTNIRGREVTGRGAGGWDGAGAPADVGAVGGTAGATAVWVHRSRGRLRAGAGGRRGVVSEQRGGGPPSRRTPAGNPGAAQRVGSAAATAERARPDRLGLGRGVRPGDLGGLRTAELAGTAAARRVRVPVSKPGRSRGEHAFHVLGVVGYRCPGLPFVAAVEAVPTVDSGHWKRLLSSLPGQPLQVVTDGGLAGRAAATVWPQAPAHRCEWHLARNLTACLPIAVREDRGDRIHALLADPLPPATTAQLSLFQTDNGLRARCPRQSDSGACPCGGLALAGAAVSRLSAVTAGDGRRSRHSGRWLPPRPSGRRSSRRRGEGSRAWSAGPLAGPATKSGASRARRSAAG